MTYFRYLDQINYRFGDNVESTGFTNLSQFSTILDQIKDDSTAYRLVQIKNGERPDVLSQRLYGTPDLHWTFFMLNEHVRNQGWPLSEQDLLTKIALDIPGECITFFGSEYNNTNGNLQHITVGQFPIGTPIYGSISGASGVVYAKTPTLGQIFIRKTNDIPFQNNESVVDTLTASPTYIIEAGSFEPTDAGVLVRSIVSDPAYLAIHHVEDANGMNVDVDYSVDFRGRPDEGSVDVLGGVFDDPDYPDIYATTSPYNIVTHLEHYILENDKLSRIRVLRSEIANQITSLLRESLR